MQCAKGWTIPVRVLRLLCRVPTLISRPVHVPVHAIHAMASHGGSEQFESAFTQRWPVALGAASNHRGGVHPSLPLPKCKVLVLSVSPPRRAREVVRRECAASWTCARRWHRGQQPSPCPAAATCTRRGKAQGFLSTLKCSAASAHVESADSETSSDRWSLLLSRTMKARVRLGGSGYESRD